MAATTDDDRQVSFDDREDRADAMHERIEGWIEDLAAETADARTSEQFQRWLAVQARFHDYSLTNQLLILQQMPDATRVAGYRTWQDLGRQVQEGESAIWIWAPIDARRCPECGNSPSYHERETVDCEEHEEGDPDTWERGVVGFRPASVFDVSQTEGEPLPDLDTDASGDPGALVPALIDAGDDLGYHVEIVPEEEWDHGRAEGVCIRHSPTDCQPVVEVKECEDEAALAGTLIHEVAHSQLHFEDVDGVERAARELEAETIAYVVGRHFGLDTSGSSFYLAAWSDDPTDQLRDRLERISVTAQAIIAAVERQEVEDGS